jgi:hypothetical protein
LKNSPIKNNEKSNEIKLHMIEDVEGTNGRISQLQVKSQAGKNEYRRIKTNQDNYILNERIFGIDYNIVGVFDGHGICY